MRIVAVSAKIRINEKIRCIRYLTEALGSDKAIADITRSDARNFRDHLGNLLAAISAAVVIGAHAVAQVDRLANINNLAAAVFHQVTSWFGRQGI